MPWVRVGDGAHSHPKVIRAGGHVWGFVTLCAAWTAEHIDTVPDYFVPEYAMPRIDAEWETLAARAADVGLFSKRRKAKDHGHGFFVDNTDPDLLHIRSADEVHADREKSRATRQTGPTRLVRLRDGDQCRYCGKSVSWTDRVSARGGTYDHPDPTDRDTFVVACFGCNRQHRDNPEQKRPPLLPIPDVPLIGPDTAQRFRVAQTAPERVTKDAAPSESASAPAAAAADAQGRSDLHLDLPSEVLQGYPRRDGPGRDGSAAQPVRAGPSRRTRRGKRAGTRNPPPTKPDEKD